MSLEKVICKIKDECRKTRARETERQGKNLQR